MDRVLHRTNDHAIGRRRLKCFKILRHRASGDRQTIAMKKSVVEKMLEHHRHPSHAIKIGHVESSTRLHVGDQRNSRCNPVEVFEIEFDSCFICDCQKMKYGVG